MVPDPRLRHNRHCGSPLLALPWIAPSVGSQRPCGGDTLKQTYVDPHDEELRPSANNWQGTGASSK